MVFASLPFYIPFFEARRTSHSKGVYLALNTVSDSNEEPDFDRKFDKSYIPHESEKCCTGFQRLSSKLILGDVVYASVSQSSCCAWRFCLF